MTTYAPNLFRKHPDEVVDISVDYSARLDVGETIVSAVAVVVAGGGSTAITTGTVTPASPVVSVVVQGGTDGQTDNVLVKATTSAAQILAGLVEIVVTSTAF